MKRNDDFFVEKKSWSKYKDELLGCYLTPYFAKISKTGIPTHYIDCFAGKGRFDSGDFGSPLIALTCIQKTIDTPNFSNASFLCTFIELNYADDLEENLKTFPTPRVAKKVIPGRFEDNIKHVLMQSSNSNVFLYFDPYGIKALNMNLFTSILVTAQCKSAELLINFNSFGIFREACRIQSVDTPPLLEMSGLAEYDKSALSSANEINQMLGTDEWISIIARYSKGQIKAHKADEEITQLFINGLHQTFTYVLELPVRAKDDTMPKYHMIHATNHDKACVLMADNMFRREEKYREERNNGQDFLFDFSVNDIPMDPLIIEKRLFDTVTYKTQSLTRIMACFYSKYGVMCDNTTLVGFFKKFKLERKTVEWRKPAVTPNGKESIFYTEAPGKRLYIRKL